MPITPGFRRLRLWDGEFGANLGYRVVNPAEWMILKTLLDLGWERVHQYCSNTVIASS